MDIHPIAIIGAGEHARVVCDVCVAAGFPVAGFLDPAMRKGALVDGRPVLGSDEMLFDATFIASHNLVPGLGGQAARLKACRLAELSAARFPRIMHPTAVVSSRAEIDAGTVLVAGAIVNTGARIGRFCIINTRASVDHDCILSDGVQIGPGAILCGTVHCGEEVLIGAGAIVLPGRRIGAGAIVGAGAVVTHDVMAATTVRGNPARP